MNHSFPTRRSSDLYYSGNFTTGFRHGYVQKIYASIRAADPPSTGEGAAIGVVDRRAARIAAPAAPAPVKSLDAARLASTWPATSRPGNAAPEPVNIGRASCRENVCHYV